MGEPAFAVTIPIKGVANLMLLTVVLMPFFLLGLVRSAGERGSASRSWLAVFLWQSLFYMHFAIRGRYALPTHPLMLLVAAAGAMALIERGRRRGTGPFAA